ncbi:MAG: GNAT family N-acetyltransferase [Polyangiaceae bacterium]|nr:GNAT family N-acetyltransferase [Polyangiaceae bacterium]MCW5789261.1 GNAT family N-acetyltransferase [Polyangiaceae bacterium]
MNKGDGFETARLIARPWRSDDVEAAFALYGDPEVVRYLGTEPIPSLTQMGLQLEAMMARSGAASRGLGVYAAEERATGEVVGTLLIKQLPDAEGALTSDIEIGWHLKRSHWGQGLATEGGRGLLDYGFHVLGLDLLHAVLEPENLRSLAVAERLGMQRRGQTKRFYRGLLVEWLSLDREAFLAQPPSTSRMV